MYLLSAQRYPGVRVIGFVEQVRLNYFHLIDLSDLQLQTNHKFGKVVEKGS